MPKKTIYHMSTPTISNADMLEIQLRKWIGKRHVPNVKLNPNYSHPFVPAGEVVIAEVIDRTGVGLFFTSRGFTVPSRGFVSYDDIQAAAWISTKPNSLTQKRKDYDHIELSLRDGSSVTVSDVEGAVFPLLHFFEWMVQKKKREDKSAPKPMPLR